MVPNLRKSNLVKSMMMSSIESMMTVSTIHTSVVGSYERVAGRDGARGTGYNGFTDSMMSYSMMGHNRRMSSVSQRSSVSGAVSYWSSMCRI